MNENIKHIKIFTASGCISFEAMQPFIEGKLDRGANEKINAHLKTCRMCREATEGVRSFYHTHDIFGTVNRINKNVRRRLDMRSRIINNQKGSRLNKKSLLFLAAASVLFVLGFKGFFMLQEINVKSTRMRLLGENIIIRDTVGYIFNKPITELKEKEKNKNDQNLKPVVSEIKTMVKENNIEDKEAIRIVNIDETSNDEIAINKYETEITYSEKKVEYSNTGTASELAPSEVYDDINPSKSAKAGKDRKFEYKKSAPVASEATTDQLYFDMVVEEITSEAVFISDKYINFNDYIKKSVDSIALKNNIKIKNLSVNVQFIINKEGKLRNPEILSSSHPKLNKLIKQILIASPEWKPAETANKKVDYTQIVNINIP